MKIKPQVILIFFLLCPFFLSAQYLPNSSFEGPPGLALTPPDWYPFDLQSTPDTEPLNCDDFEASDGNTYVTLVAHGSESSFPGTMENCQAELNQPLQEGFCYTLSMDLASRDDLGHYNWGEGFVHYDAKVYLRIFGSNSSSEKGSLLAETHTITNVNWENTSFTIKPESDIYYLVLEVTFEEAGISNGNILIDKMVLTDIVPESIVQLNDTIRTEDLPFALEASESESYSWSPNSGLTCYDCRSPEVNSNTSGTYTCTIISETTGCPGNELFILTFIEEPIIPGDFKIPNVFTPNGDGTNDRFEITGLPLYSALLIYDRSGREVFSSEEYTNEWEGSDMEGNSLPEDTYWYVLITPGLNGKYKGSVYLKRK